MRPWVSSSVLKKNLKKTNNSADVGLPGTPKASADLRLNPVLGSKSWCLLVDFTLVALPDGRQKAEVKASAHVQCLPPPAHPGAVFPSLGNAMCSWAWGCDAGGPRGQQDPVSKRILHVLPCLGAFLIAPLRESGFYFMIILIKASGVGRQMSLIFTG